MTSRSFRKNASSGFSLVEFALVMIVSGLLFAALMSIYVVYAKRVKMETTYERLFAANSLMTESWNLERRYFCPADPTLKQGDINYGKENCPPAGTPIGSCTNGTTGVCVGQGVASDLGNPRVLIGMYPFATVIETYANNRSALQQAYENAIDPNLKASLKRSIEVLKKSQVTRARDMAFDGWGNQFTYAVSEAHRYPTPEDAGNTRIAGSIEIVNAAHNDDARRGVHFAIISHGENGRGAYNRRSKRVIPCDDAQLTEIERENCNIDGKFLRPAVASLGKNADETDDLVIYNSYISQELWRVTQCETDGNPATKEVCIYNTNPGNVGIGLEGSAIAEKLTVDGQLRAEKIETTEICDANGANCFMPGYIGGERMNTCSQDGLNPNQKRVAVQISNKTMRCEVITLPGYNSSCPPGHVVTGFDSSGLLCANPCRPRTATGSGPCPGNQIGQIDYATTLNCDVYPNAWGPWQASPNCAEPEPTPQPTEEPTVVPPAEEPTVVPPTEEPPVTPPTEEPPVVPPTEDPPSTPCTPTHEDQPAACPTGQTGSIIRRRYYQCPSGTWTGWSEIHNDCVTACSVWPNGTWNHGGQGTGPDGACIHTYYNECGQRHTEVDWQGGCS